MPHILERAPTGRAKCRGCGQLIAAGLDRFGERRPNPYAEGEEAEMTHWFHVACAAYKRPEPFLEFLATTAEAGDENEALASFKHEAELGVAHRRLVRVDTTTRAPSARAACRACREKIEKDAWRIGLVFYEDGRFTPAGYVHVACAPGYFETPEILPRLKHFSPALTETDLADIRSALAPGS